MSRPTFNGIASYVTVACIVASGGWCTLVATRLVDSSRSLTFALTVTTVAVVVAAGAVTLWQSSGRSARRVLISPFPFAAITWLALFVYRPVELYLAPTHAAVGLADLGFRLGDLTRTVALGGVGSSVWMLGYLVGVGRPAVATPVAARRPFLVSTRRGAIAIAIGTILWLLLFLRDGGFGALLHSAASVHVQQNASFWAFVGVWMVQGAALYALAALLQTPTPALRWLVLAGATSAVACAVGLQLRALLAFAVAAAALLVADLRRIRRRELALAACVVAAGAVALPFFQQVRAYSVTVPTTRAISLALHTPLQDMYVSDLSTFDHFVAIQSLVPQSIQYLDGRSLVDIPESVVPRSLWHGKPRSIDFRVSSYLYPGIDVAVPISVQGELYWNAGVPGIILGAVLLGLALGALAQFGTRARRGSGAFVVYVALVPFTHHLLTRGLSTMVENVLFAAAGTILAIWLMARERPPLRTWGERLLKPSRRFLARADVAPRKAA